MHFSAQLNGYQTLWISDVLQCARREKLRETLHLIEFLGDDVIQGIDTVLDLGQYASCVPRRRNLSFPGFLHSYLEGQSGCPIFPCPVGVFCALFVAGFAGTHCPHIVYTYLSCAVGCLKRVATR
jgi:hypothetical protein